jgi:hypothetical protein
MNRAGRASHGAPVRPGSTQTNPRKNLIIAGLMLALMLTSLCMRFVFVTEPVYKTAITEDALKKSGARYVLCTWAPGSGWFAERENSGETIDRYCRITGQNPLDAGFKDVYMKENCVFVLYWESKRTDSDGPVYEISNWTVLAPVKRSFPFNLYRPERYIVESDVKAAA